MLMQHELEDQMSEDELIQLLGSPLVTPRVRTVSGLPPARAPKRLLVLVDLTPLVQHQSNKIAIVDFRC